MASKDEEVLIIFNRSINNREEDFANQQAFRKTYKEYIDSGFMGIIDYETLAYPKMLALFESLKNRNKITLISQSFLSKNAYYSHYNLVSCFNLLKTSGTVSKYLMDCDGNIYKEVKLLEML